MGVFLFEAMSNFFIKGDTTIADAAAFAAGLGFANVNFDLGNAPLNRIDHIECSVFTDIADQAAVDLITVNIYRNVLINGNLDLAPQLSGSGLTTLHEFRSQDLRDFNAYRDYSNGFILDSQFRYSIVGVVSLNAALAGSLRINLFVNGRIEVPEGKAFFGTER